MRVIFFLIYFTLSTATIAQTTLPELPEPTENEARDIVEMHLGIRPNAIDMSNVERWNYGTHLTVSEGGYFTLVRLESKPYKSENDVCRKKQLRLIAPSWEVPPHKLMKYPEWRQDIHYAAPLLPGSKSCSDIKVWAKIDSSILLADQIFEIFEKTKDWLTSVSRSDFCASTKMDNSEYCLHLYNDLKSGANAATLEFAKLYGVASGNEADASIALYFRMGETDTQIHFFAHVADEADLFKHVTIVEVMP